ncbi:hypothetical protein EYF80_026942 [Liparis tanakae]|uniref:Uncharacterized protein n=1 Tax=Liparis tanakae TaxID=230148 RepID=A0A4Z2HAE4_9TELE|nr:hypothetical protein EYF80_026942 [Liparis tanakae]
MDLRQIGITSVAGTTAPNRKLLVNISTMAEEARGQTHLQADGLKPRYCYHHMLFPEEWEHFPLSHYVVVLWFPGFNQKLLMSQTSSAIWSVRSPIETSGFPKNKTNKTTTLGHDHVDNAAAACSTKVTE